MSKIVSKVNKNTEAYQENFEYHSGLVDTLRGRIHEVVHGGRDHLIERHRKRGKLLPRERIDLLVDPCTPFLEFSSLAAYDQYGYCDGYRHHPWYAMCDCGERLYD